MKAELTFKVLWFGTFLIFGLYNWLANDRPGFLWGVLLSLAITTLIENRRRIRDFKRRQARRGRRAKLSARRKKRSKWETFHSPKSRS